MIQKTLKYNFVMVCMLFLIGCGSGSSSKKIINNLCEVSTVKTFEGTAVDGYISGATVCVDINNNSICEQYEPSTITNKDGTYSFGTSKLNQIRPDSKILLVGGIDTSTHRRFDGILKAPLDLNNSDKIVISPLSTLIAILSPTNNAQDIDAAKTKIAYMFNINKEDLTKDPLDLALHGNMSALKVGYQLETVLNYLNSAKSAKLQHELTIQDKNDMLNQFGNIVSNNSFDTNATQTFSTILQKFQTLPDINITNNMLSDINLFVAKINTSMDEFNTDVNITTINATQSNIQNIQSGLDSYIKYGYGDSTSGLTPAGYDYMSNVTISHEIPSGMTPELHSVSVPVGIPEDTPSYTLVATVPILNMGSSAITQMRLIGDGSEYFTINEFGEIRTSSLKLDFNRFHELHLNIVATNNEGDSSSVEFYTKILHKPIIYDDLEIHVGELIDNYAILRYLSATDGGIPATYTLQGEGAEQFLVTSDGVLRTAKNANLDYETKNHYELTVYAQNSLGRSETKNITINVDDYSEQSPVIGIPGETNYVVPTSYVFDKTNVSKFVGQVFIKNGGGSAITYFDITPNVTDLVIDHKTGVISIAPGKTIDYYKHHQYDYNITVTNKHGLSTIESRTTTVYRYPYFLNAQLEFDKSNITTTSNGTHAVTAVDLDQDQDIDIIAATNTPSIVWYKNNGAQVYSESTLISNTKTNKIITADIDHDGDIDILYSAANGTNTVWQENNGTQNDLNFIKHDINDDNLTNIDLIDIDQDGDYDIVTTKNSDNTIGWLENDGSQNFTSHIIDDNLTQVIYSIGIDLDKDGNIDIVAATQDGVIKWYENDGSQSFTAQDINSSDLKFNKIVAVDLDRDGDIDIVATAEDNNTVYLYDNNGSQSFDAILIDDNVTTPSDIVIADMNNDTDQDIIVSSTDNNATYFYDNNGSASFIRKVISSESGAINSIFVTDIDKDTQFDLISSVETSSILPWFKTINTQTVTTNDPENCTIDLDMVHPDDPNAYYESFSYVTYSSIQDKLEVMEGSINFYSGIDNGEYYITVVAKYLDNVLLQNSIATERIKFTVEW